MHLKKGPTGSGLGERRSYDGAGNAEAQVNKDCNLGCRGVRPFTIIGFLVLPPVAKSVLVKQLSKALHRDVSIEKIKINPYTLSFSMKGLMIKDRGKQETFVSLGELSTTLSGKSIFKRAPIITRLRL